MAFEAERKGSLDYRGPHRHILARACNMNTFQDLGTVRVGPVWDMDAKEARCFHLAMERNERRIHLNLSQR